MNEVQISIKRLYQIFGIYSTDGIHHCDCGCISADDVAKLNSKSLEALTAEDLSAYNMSAISTWGDVVHYKHYLPRICECISTDRTQHYLSLPQLLDKLEYAKWKDWPAHELKSIIDYVAADWVALIHSRDAALDEQVFITYGKVMAFEEMLQQWQIRTSDIALNNLVVLFSIHGPKLLSGRSKKLPENHHRLIYSWLIENDIFHKLETSFFDSEESDPAHATRISSVIQMLEQEGRILGTK